MENTEQRINIIPLGFDEQYYLVANPDVAQAVSNGQFESGLEHYRKFGRFEDRLTKHGLRAAPPLSNIRYEKLKLLSRRNRILGGIDLTTASGLEIGALCFPLVTHEEGQIFYVDFATTEELKKTYANDPAVDVSKIVKVDAIWGDRSLGDCVERKTFDYVVASHVVEHVPDLVTWLAEIASVLEPTGSLRLAAPDRRFTFDYLRYESRLHDVLDAYVNKQRRPSSRQILENSDLCREVDYLEAWKGQIDPTKLKPKSSVIAGLDLARQSLGKGTYFDTHCWIFTPRSFCELMLRLAELDLLALKCDMFIPTQFGEIEFIVHMSSCQSKPEILHSWNAASKIEIPSYPSVKARMKARFLNRLLRR